MRSASAPVRVLPAVLEPTGGLFGVFFSAFSVEAEYGFRSRPPECSSMTNIVSTAPHSAIWARSLKRLRTTSFALRRASPPLALAIAFALQVAPARAFPGLFAGKGDAPRVSNSTQLVLLEKGDRTVVTVWSDYEGPLDHFALVLPVPPDVELADVRTLKRDPVDHLDEISAPRFHEFWEMDPCEPGQAEQEWERDLSVKDSAVNFLGAGLPDTSSGTKLAPELLLDVTPQFKQGEYAFRLVPKGQSVKAYLQGRGLSLPKGGEEALRKYESNGMQVLVAEVAASKVELAGARRALLSPIRFSTRQPYSIPETLGLANGGGPEELLVYVLHPTQRFEVANYPNVYPPTNVNVDPSVKERVADFYAGVHDAVLAKNPKSFLVEYAWPTIKQCGEPCPNAPLKISELLSLGADVVEEDVPKAERNPKPPEPTDAEREQMKKADKKTKKLLEEQRREVARRQALLARNSYVVTRLHYRYDSRGLPEDIQLRPAGAVHGGIGAPTGPNADLSEKIEPASDNRLQIRYSAVYPNKKVVQCENPQRFRWGKAPPTYRGLRKTWTATDLAFKKRDRFKLEDVVKSAVPELGIAGTPIAVTEASGAAPSKPAEPAATEKSSCAMEAVGRGSWSWRNVYVTLGLACTALRRRKRHQS
jgi:hypothetical protein